MSLVKRSLVTALGMMALAVPALSTWAAPAMSADWPQWRGPHRDGRSQETGLLKEWPKEGPHPPP